MKKVNKYKKYNTKEEEGLHLNYQIVWQIKTGGSEFYQLRIK